MCGENPSTLFRNEATPVLCAHINSIFAMWQTGDRGATVRMPGSLWKVKDYLASLNDQQVARDTLKMLSGRPNTYTYTKAVAENIICTNSGGRPHLPVCIVRPSMIVPAYKEPFPGWCTNVYGPTAFFIAYGKGFLRSVIADRNVVADLIPVDLVVNGVLAAAYKTASDNYAKMNRNGKNGFMKDPSNHQHEQEEVGVPFYNLTTGHANPIRISELERLGRLYYADYPLDPIRLPSLRITTNRLLHTACVFLRQTVPAFLCDAVFTVINPTQKFSFRRVNDKIKSSMDVMEFFFVNQWQWRCDNTKKMHQFLSEEDQKTFNFDPQSFRWEDHIKHYVIGTRNYLMKEDVNRYPLARRAIKRLRILNNAINFLMFYCLWRFCKSNQIFNKLRQLFIYVFVLLKRSFNMLKITWISHISIVKLKYAILMTPVIVNQFCRSLQDL